MISHSYSIDSQDKITDLTAKILSASAPPQIAAVISAVESHLHKQSPDRCRYFFSIAFPTLICKLFGFDDAAVATATAVPPPSTQKPLLPTGWIDAVCDSEVSGRLFNLLSPNGMLMSSIMAVDKLAIVKYLFPIERLPQWTQLMLSNERDCRVLEDICPLFKGRLKADPVKGLFQVQLNVFEYYLFWFAYYPICKGSSANSVLVSAKKSNKSRIENWTSSIPVFSGGGTKRGFALKNEVDLYTRLLFAYLTAFVPICDVNAYQPYRSSLLHYATDYDDASLQEADFLVSTLTNYWLVDNDFSPLPVNVRKSFGLHLSFHAILSEVPPASGLAEVVKLFVKYLNLCAVSSTDWTEPFGSCCTPSWRSISSGDAVKSRTVALGMAGSPSGGSWNSCIQRPVYRFILRTLLFCPMGSSMKNVSDVVSLWISYMEPWKLNKEEFAMFETDNLNQTPEKDVGHSIERKYSANWQGYALSNYLYYTSLVMHFIGFAHKFLHTDAGLIVHLVSKVINVLTSSTELLELLRNVDNVFHSRHAGSSKSMLNSLYKFVTPIREQLQDWEDGLCETDVDGSFLHENWNKDLRLFGDGEDGGQRLLQLFLLRAEAELQGGSADPSSLQCLESLKSELRCLFGDQAVKPSSIRPLVTPIQQSRDDIFKPRKVVNRPLGNVQYRGDRMKRPVSDDEVAWLANILVLLSCGINEGLGLNQAEGIQENPNWSYVEVYSELGNGEYGPDETMKVVLYSVAAWLLSLRSAVARLMIKCGVRVNLRLFASKKFVTLLVLFAVVSLLKRWLRSFW